uniref:Uncharacterized protein n=1 Tax=Magnetococcus massalia (strain MO-1) TaxID=451514 RepID=A0A1S7LJU5_MAGMO|nr:protein of unknown function [Candidatus Magnetococcus massalia]
MHKREDKRLFKGYDYKGIVGESPC